MATVTAGMITVPLDQIHIPSNVRELDQDHVDALAGSIALQGLIVPIVVRPNGDSGYVLVAGFHRFAAHRQLGLEEIAVVVRDEEREESDRAVENVTRLALRPDEPRGIALGASFDRLDDAIASGFGAIRGSRSGRWRQGILLLLGWFQRGIRIRCNIVAVIATACG